MKIEAFIFDLDGVIVDTARFHYIAWKRMANAIGTDLSIEENEQLKGVSRRQSMEAILEWGQIEMKEAEILRWMTRKNEWYLELVDVLKPENALPGAIEFLKATREAGLKVALGSASKNARKILNGLGLIPCFDSIVDGSRTTLSKPDPQVFEIAARDLEVEPKSCVVFEDAIRGIEAANRGGFHSIGIGDPDILNEAHFVIPGLMAETPESIIHRFRAARI